ncbi:MAG TPA: DUF2203 domain-containing protein [Blastocatellia bacterium]|nr:DUF2203 domain-containing protein [Blastocatellia bacterium]
MKLFTLEEANAMLPELRRLFAVIKTERATLQRLAPEAKRASDQASAGGGTVFGHRYASALFHLMDQLQTIHSLGVEIKDLERGLCDFPALREGRVVYLCWLLGEDRIEWWHDLEAGFAGRQPL